MRGVRQIVVAGAAGIAHWVGVDTGTFVRDGYLPVRGAFDERTAATAATTRSSGQAGGRDAPGWQHRAVRFPSEDYPGDLA